MIQFTERLDKALRMAARAHEKQGQHRKGSDIPYIIHPVGVMLIANQATDDEDTLIACLLHDVLEDVDPEIYSEDDMRRDFGDQVVRIINDVTNSPNIQDWHENRQAYADHLEREACDEAVIVSSADKIHNLTSTITDYKVTGDDLWQRFTTKNVNDQFWWYETILGVLKKRRPEAHMTAHLEARIAELRSLVEANAKQAA